MRILSRIGRWWGQTAAAFLLTSCVWATVPNWVRTAAGASLPKYEPDTDAVVLLDRITDLALSGVAGWNTVPVLRSNVGGPHTLGNLLVGSFGDWSASSAAAR